jgi:Flp pilus assembly protein TadD
VQQFATPLEQATTPSLEALKEFTAGYNAHSRNDGEGAITHLQKAVELDPNFAGAYAILGVSLTNTAQVTQGRMNIAKAAALKDRATERERFYIEAHEADQVNLDEEKALQIYQQWYRAYPRDTVPLVNQSVVYAAKGDCEKMLEVTSETKQINPLDVFANMWDSIAYTCLARYDEARAVVQQAQEKKIAGSLIYIAEYWLAYVKKDTTGLERVLEETKNAPYIWQILMLKGEGEAAQGKLKTSHATYEEARGITTKDNLTEPTAFLSALEAAVQAGNCGEAKRLSHASLETIPEGRNRNFVALALAACGDAAGTKLGHPHRWECLCPWRNQKWRIGHACTRVLWRARGQAEKMEGSAEVSCALRRV